MKLFSLCLVFSLLITSVSFAENNENHDSLRVEQKVTVPREYVVPRVASNSAMKRLVEVKSCLEYLQICQRSCSERGSMFKFQCIGEDFQPFSKHYACYCADDIRLEKR